jgi:hypothetical protein
MTDYLVVIPSKSEESFLGGRIRRAHSNSLERLERFELFERFKVLHPTWQFNKLAAFLKQRTNK